MSKEDTSIIIMDKYWGELTKALLRKPHNKSGRGNSGLENQAPQIHLCCLKMNGKAPAKSRIPQVRSKLPSSRLPSSQIPSSKSKSLRQTRGDTVVSNPLRDTGSGLRKPSENKDNRSNRYEEASLSRNNCTSSSVKAKHLKSSNFKGLGGVQGSGLAPYASAKSLSKSSLISQDNISISSDEVPPPLNTRTFLVTSNNASKSDQLRKDPSTEMSSVATRANVDPDILAFERFKESVPRSGTSNSLYSSSEKSFGGSQEHISLPNKQTSKKTESNKLASRSLSKSRLGRKQPASAAADGKTLQHKSRLNLPEETVTSSVNTLNYVKKLNSHHEASKRNAAADLRSDSPSPNDFVTPKAPIQLKASTAGKLGSKRGPLGSRWANDSDQSRTNPSKNSTDSNINRSALRSRLNDQGVQRKKYQSLKPKLAADNGRQFLKITEVPDEFLDDCDLSLPRYDLQDSEQYFDGRNNHSNVRRNQTTRSQPTIRKKQQQPALVAAASSSLAATTIARIARPVLRPQKNGKDGGGSGVECGTTTTTGNERFRQPAAYLSTSSSHTDSLANSVDENGSVVDTTSQNSIDEPTTPDEGKVKLLNSPLEMDTNHNPASLPPKSNTESFDNQQQMPGNLSPEEEERLMERKRQNERYMDILQNQDMLNFGHWRMRQEGNYSPEEKYGFSERRVIRTTSTGSHTSSSDITDSNKTKLDKLTVSDASDEHVDKAGVDETVTLDCDKKTPDDIGGVYLSGFRTSLSKSKTKEADEVHDGLKDVTLESLPSIGSTTLMADLGESLLDDETEEDVCPRKENNNAINNLLKGGYGEILNRCKDEVPPIAATAAVGRSGRGGEDVEKCSAPVDAIARRYRSSSNRTKASTNDNDDDLRSADAGSRRSLLLDEAVAATAAAAHESACISQSTAEHSKKLASNLDDMQSDVQIFKQALMQMQSCLEQEEEEKEKVKTKCKDLELEREQLKEEIEKLKQIIRKKEEEESIRQEAVPERPESREVATSAAPTPVDTSDSGSQTDDFEQRKIDNMKLNLEMASQYINKLKHARAHYDETMQQTEEAIHGVLLDLNQT